MPTIKINSYKQGPVTVEYNPNMTWGDWIDSNYNTLDLYAEGNIVVEDSEGLALLSQEGGIVYTTDYIDASYTYYTHIVI